MVLILALIIGIALAVFVAYPVLAPELEGAAPLPIDITPEADLKRRRMVLYDNLQDLEFEFKSKRIAENDYRTLRESYKVEAARLMAASQELESGSLDDKIIEREVAVRRQRRRDRIAEAYLCPHCGFENPVPVKFCGECGKPITKAQNPPDTTP